MARNNGHRPHRGHPGPNVLVSGDTGPRQPQGGARDIEREGPSESGDLAAREFGVPQADIPGGLRHMVNPQTRPDSPGPKVPRPVDYHKEHGVEPHDWGQYVTPPDESEHYPAERPAPLEHVPDAVPVFIVEAEHKQRRIRSTSAFNVNVRAAGSEPSRVCNRDPDRVMVLLLNEDSANDCRISESLTDLLTTSAAGTGPAGSGALIPHALNSYTKIETQDDLWAIGTSANSVRLSVILVTEVPETVGIA